MKSLPVGEFKAQFSDLLEEVQQGETIEIVFGKKKTPVARLVPINGPKTTKRKRKIGILEGKVNIKFAKNFKMTEDEFLGLK
jgi:prevent-host-death family protein